jgi:hypothetical protein
VYNDNSTSPPVSEGAWVVSRERWRRRSLRHQIRDGGIDGTAGDQPLGASEVRDLLVFYSQCPAAAVEPFRLRDVHIGGSLDLSHMQLGFDLDLTGCVFAGELVLTGAKTGSVQLSHARLHALVAGNARVGGDLVLHGARVAGESPREPVAAPDTAHLYRSGDQVQSAVRTIDAESRSPVLLTSSHIDGDVVMTDATVDTVEAWAVYAPRLQVAGSFIASGLRATGGIKLSEARFENSIVLDRAHVHGVEANIVTMRGGFLADWGFVSTGPLDLLAMQAGNIVTFHDAELRGTPVSANLTRLTASRIRLDMRARPRGRLILRDVRTESLVDSTESWPAKGDLDLEGLRYGRISATDEVTVGQRVDWLTRDGEIASSSFERLAAHYQTSGDERSARTVRLARERCLVRRKKMHHRLWGWTQDALFGYGFAPVRALLWLAALVGGGAWWFSLHSVLPVSAQEHPSWDPAIYALDLVVPIVDLGQERAWDPTGANKAVAMTLVIAGWLLATAVVAGARRLLNRP